jgi:secreted Zn-dependent insulinase-like peptidase
VGPKTLANDYQSFLVRFRETLEDMASEEFEQHKNGLIAKLTEKPQRLSQLSDRYWQEIDQEQTNFDTRERLVSEISNITQDQLLAFYERFFFGQKSRELLIQYQGESIGTSGSEMIDVKHLIETPKNFKHMRVTF